MTEKEWKELIHQANEGAKDDLIALANGLK